jgi:NAD(P)-dependent dehydrogenase (short-subunit alcohol dehydrogenase family)
VAERMCLAGRTAVVTGAANSIGRAIAVSLAKRGCHLVLADIDEVGMAGTSDLMRASGVVLEGADVTRT